MFKVIFYGASVTHQSKGEGYFEYLKKSFEFNDLFHFDRLSFPACHFNDAGFLNHNLLLNMNPNIVIFEWNTTGLAEFDEKKLNVMILGCLKNKIIPAFLILPRVSTNLNINRRCEDQVIELCKMYDLPLLDLRKLSNIVLLLRDDVHTNNLGAKEYSEKILDWINKGFSINSEKINNLIYPAEINIKPTQLPISKIENSLSLNLVITGEMPEIVVVGKVGPYSPVAKISIDNDFSIIKKSFWDPWCYYERVMTISLTEYMKFPSKNGEILLFKVEIDDKAPDYDKCNEPNFKYEEKRFVNIDEFYLIDLEIAK
jgi:hypothetical protein